jgi:hypothetical protein
LLPFLKMSEVGGAWIRSFPAVERLQAGAAKNEQDLERLRQRIEELRFDGQRTTEAESVFERFEATHQRLLAKLDTLRREQAAAD